MSGAVIIKDFERMETFINNLDGLTGELYLHQSEINAAYNRVGDWDDHVFRLTGRALLNTGNKVEQLGAFLSKLMMILNEYCLGMDRDYLGKKEWNGHFRDKELETRLHLEDSNMERAILGTTADGIKSFERELETYINVTKENVNKVVRELDDVRSYWQDDNFRKTEERIMQFSDNMHSNLSALSDLLTMVTIRRKSFEKNQAELAQKMSNL